MKVEERGVNSLTPYAGNPRRIPQRAVDAVAESIRRFGFRVPLVIDGNGVVVCGHTRLKAAKKLRLKAVPCVVADDLSEAELRAFRVADNRTAEFSEWDFGLLGRELAGLPDMDLLGFAAGDFSPDASEPMTEEQVASEMEAAETKDEAGAGVKPGDLWRLGEHLLLCGDATNPESYARLFADGEQADMILTDPPYGVSYADKDRNAALHGKIQNDDLDEGALTDFLAAAFSAMADALRPGGAWYVFYAMATAMATATATAIRRSPLKRERQVLIWNKCAATLSWSDYQWKHEPLLYGVKDGAVRFWRGERTLTTVIGAGRGVSELSDAECRKIVERLSAECEATVLDEKKPSRNASHPTMKPVGLLMRLIHNSSRSGEIVLDPFAGSGSTLAACAKGGRKCRLIELSPRYCDVILKRWETLSGEKTERIAEKEKEKNQKEKGEAGQARKP